eukprot:TRINITY_DN65185_c0_g1_i1.p1 TRINITY_DN65185_c0_g1~~TRINITY_DN65185_c0_g1_i1.p1  ORF type:complete len:386 (+),score=99.94 TRINITY_DN65185_c0_g1_i1:94-1251(+)
MNDGKYKWVPVRNPVFRCCFLVFAVVGAMSGAAVVFQVWKEIQEQQDAEEARRGMDSPAQCIVTAVGEYEERLSDPTGRCDVESEKCEFEARSSVTVSYVVDGTRRVSTAWSTIDGEYRDGVDLARDFLERFGTVSAEFPCWYNAAAPDQVRLWERRREYVDRAEFYVPLAFFSLCVIVVGAIVVDRHSGTLRRSLCCCCACEERKPAAGAGQTVDEAMEQVAEKVSPRAPYMGDTFGSPPPPRRMSQAERAELGLIPPPPGETGARRGSVPTFGAPRRGSAPYGAAAGGARRGSAAPRGLLRPHGAVTPPVAAGAGAEAPGGSAGGAAAPPPAAGNTPARPPHRARASSARPPRPSISGLAQGSVPLSAQIGPLRPQLSAGGPV